MGAFLEKPNTDKETHSGDGCGIKYAVSAMQGWRMEMEDAHICTTDFGLKNWSFFGIFDGHAGSKVAKYCAQHLLESIMSNLSTNHEEGEYSVEAIKTAIHKGFLAIDEQMKNEPQWANGQDRSGTTAVVAMVSPTHIIWGNCGDSRGILCRNSSIQFATQDHKPFNDLERKRIEKAGGTVMMQRVNGSLAVSRALGDFDYKRAVNLPATEQLVSPEPDLMVVPRDGQQDEFMLLACDGIYDVMQNDEVVKYVRHRLELTDNLGAICNDLLDLCLYKNSRDNMSVILVTFPSAPKVSPEAVEKAKKAEEQIQLSLQTRLNAIVELSTDPLELEEGHIVQVLSEEFPSSNVYEQRNWISTKLEELKVKKFGTPKNDVEFSGPSDPSEAPPGLRLSEDQPVDEQFYYDDLLVEEPMDTINTDSSVHLPEPSSEENNSHNALTEATTSESSNQPS